MLKRALILGSANCLERDLQFALSLSEFDIVVACKGAGLAWRGKLDAWVTLHPQGSSTLPPHIDLVKRREALGYPPAGVNISHPRIDGKGKVASDPGIDRTMHWKFPGQKLSGSSGLFALLVAVTVFGCNRNVLCGMPLQREQGRLDDKAVWKGASSFRAGFMQALPHIRDNTRSCSGWTKQLLGHPTSEWLAA